jgi:probable F420-dependent oxidoreductase
MRMEAAGYSAAWTGEGIGGKDSFTEMALMLAATKSMAVGTASSIIWARAAVTANAAARMLASAFPGRMLFGMAVGYAHQAERVGMTYEKPAKTMEAYLAAMATECPDEPLPDCPRLVGANGPRMLDVAARCADGAVPSVVPPLYIEQARKTLGPDKLLAAAVPLICGTDRQSAQEQAGQIIKGIVGFPGSPYGLNLRRLGYSEEDLSGPSARLRDDVVAYGDPERVAESVRTYLDAGADHVVLSPITGDLEVAIEWLAYVAPAVNSLEKSG